MFGLPKPQSFEDGQRQFFGVAMVSAGIFAGLTSLGMVGLFYYIAISNPTMMALCLKIIAGGFGGFLLSMVIVILSMAVGGPVGRFKLSASKEGVNIEADGDGEAPAPASILPAVAPPEIIDPL